MAARRENEFRPPHAARSDALARQWSRTLWAMALLFGSLPVAGRLIWGAWEFGTAGAIGFLCAVLGAYLRIRGRPARHPLPDDAAVLNRALELAAAGECDQAIALLTHAIRTSPRLWQAFQYRGQLHLWRTDSPGAALEDFNEAIRLAPREAHLYFLRAQAWDLLDNKASASADYETAAALSAEPGTVARGGEGLPQ
jgi:tetratricopeptide (TPR) repeat protein